MHSCKNEINVRQSSVSNRTEKALRAAGGIFTIAGWITSGVSFVYIILFGLQAANNYEFLVSHGGGFASVAADKGEGMVGVVVFLVGGWILSGIGWVCLLKRIAFLVPVVNTLALLSLYLLAEGLIR